MADVMEIVRLAEQHTLTDVATILGISEDVVRKQYRKALTQEEWEAAAQARKEMRQRQRVACRRNNESQRTRDPLELSAGHYAVDQRSYDLLVGGPKQEPDTSCLTPTEKQIYALHKSGLSSYQIATISGIGQTDRAVRWQLQRIREKLSQ